MNTFTTHTFLITITILSMVYLSQPYRHSRHSIKRYHRATFYPPSSFPSSFSSPYFPRSFYSPSLSVPFPQFHGRRFQTSFFQTPRRPPVRLFTPNTIEQPAETKGQIEEYRKDLEELAKELGNGIEGDAFLELGSDGDERADEGRNYVDVRSSHYNYSYFN